MLLSVVMFLLGALPAAAAPRYTCLDLNTVQPPGFTVSSTHPRGITQDGTVAGYGDIEPTTSPLPSRRSALSPQSGSLKGAGFLFNLLWGVEGFQPIYDTNGSSATYAEGVRNKSGNLDSQTKQSFGPRPYYVTGVWKDTTSPYYFHAFLYDGDSGTSTALGNLGGSGSYSQSYANGVNDAGQVVGYSYTSSGTQHAFLYSGSMQDLFGAGDSHSSEATGINNAGQVVGVYGGSAFLLNGGVGGVKTDLSTKLNPPFIYNSYATAINTTGQVAGYSSDSSGYYRAFLYSYSNDSMKDLGSLGGYLCQALGLNDFGQVVGYSQTATEDVRAFLYSGGVMYDLNSLVQNLPAGVVLTQAFGINNRGQIIADGGSGGYSGHGYLLTPIVSAGAPLDLLLLQ
jgi:probable HAF family extracellular repeat protein